MYTLQSLVDVIWEQGQVGGGGIDIGISEGCLETIQGAIEDGLSAWVDPPPLRENFGMHGA